MNHALSIPAEVIELLNKLDAEQKAFEAFEAYKAEQLRRPLNFKHWVKSGKGL